MNQLKPYLLWIIAGVVSLIVVIMMVVWTPKVEDKGEAKDAYEIKSLLDHESKNLQDLFKRARKGDPLPTLLHPEPWDAQSDADIKTLTSEYLLTKLWIGEINPKVEKYGRQLGQIRDDLRERSKVINVPVANNEDKQPWYVEYEKLTGQLVVKMRDAGCLDGISGVNPTADPPVPQAQPTDATNGEARSLDPNTGDKIRSMLGLFTKTGSEYPEPKEHNELTAHFRIAERVSAAIMDAMADTLPNPLIPSSGGVRMRPAVVSWEWKPISETLAAPLDKNAKPWRLSVTIKGNESALMAALAKIEGLDRPIQIVLGSTLLRIPSAGGSDHKVQGPRGEAVAVAAQLNVDILVLDFSDMPELTPSADQGASTPAENSKPAGKSKSAPAKKTAGAESDEQ